MASPSQLTHLLEDWISLLSFLWILSFSGLAFFCNSWCFSRCCTISRICDSFTHGTQTRRDRGGLVLAFESYPWTRSYQSSSSTRRPDFCTMSLRSSRHYDQPYVGTFGHWQYGTCHGYYGPSWYIFRTSTSLRPVSNRVKFCTQLPPSCSILLSRGSPDPIQGHYPLQQHQGAFHWRNPLARAFPLSWPWTLLLWSFGQLGVVPTYSGLLATSFRDSPCTRTPSFSQCAHWDDISSRGTEPYHPDPRISHGSFWGLEGCYGIWGIQWDVGDGWTHELPRCFRSPSTSSEFFFFWLKWSPVCRFGFYRFTLTGVLPIPPAKFFQKIQPRYMRGVCVYHLNRCKTSDWFSLVCRGVQSTVETAPNEAIHLCWKQSLINSVYLQNLVSTVDQAVTLRCFESTRLPQSVLHASEPSSDFRRNHIADSIMTFWHIFAEIMSPTNFGLFWETIAETLLWILNMLVKTLWILVLTSFDNIGCPTSFSRSTSCGSFTNLTI